MNEPLHSRAVAMAGGTAVLLLALNAWTASRYEARAQEGGVTGPRHAHAADDWSRLLLEGPPLPTVDRRAIEDHEAISPKPRGARSPRADEEQTPPRREPGRPWGPPHDRPTPATEITPSTDDETPKVDQPQPTPSSPAPATPAVDGPMEQTATPRGPLDVALRQAAAATASAFQLADRRALYTARSDLLEALRRIADTLDETYATTRHSEALSLALLTLREGDDFLPRGNALACGLDVARIASVHRTPAAATLPADAGSPAQAIRHYYGFAQQELARAFQPAPAASMPLCGLGKLYVEIAREPLPQLANTKGKAVVFQQAAVTVNPNDWHAANELGVLLARVGHWDEAAGWLLHSLEASPTAEGWHNLAVAYQQLGQEQLASEAHQTAAMLGYVPSRAARPTVEWVSPAALTGAKGRRNRAASTPAAARSAAKPAPAAGKAERGLLRWLPWQ